MATPMCMSGDGRPATFVGTMLTTGDGFTLCDECLVSWCAALLQATTGLDPAPFIAALSTDSAPAEPGTDAGAVGTEPDLDPPIGRTKAGVTVGRSRKQRSSGTAATGGGPRTEDD